MSAIRRCWYSISHSTEIQDQWWSYLCHWNSIMLSFARIELAARILIYLKVTLQSLISFSSRFSDSKRWKLISNSDMTKSKLIAVVSTYFLRYTKKSSVSSIIFDIIFRKIISFPTAFITSIPDQLYFL